MKSIITLLVSAGVAILGGQSSLAAVFVDPVSGSTDFVVDFGHPPDLFNADSLGRQNDSFQFFVFQPGPEPPNQRYDAIVRGEEIHSSGLIRIRAAFPSDFTDPLSQGWGVKRWEGPFDLNQDILTFSAPLAALGVDPHFEYRLEFYNQGSLRLTGFGFSDVPETLPGLTCLAFAVVLMAGIERLRRE